MRNFILNLLHLDTPWECLSGSSRFIISLVTMVVFTFLAVLFCTCVSGCTPDPSGPAPVQEFEPSTVEIQRDTKRSEVKSYGEFYGGYRDNEREIFIVTDRTTEKQYLVITGAGVSEIVMEKKYDSNGKSQLRDIEE